MSVDGGEEGGGGQASEPLSEASVGCGGDPSALERWKQKTSSRLPWAT